MVLRIGHGYDAHRFVAGRRLVLGGVTVPHDMGLAAHSDGDVLIHAVSDALLGALALGDIGSHFPDSAAEFAGIDSRILLRDVASKMTAAGFRLGNLDVTVVAQVPKLAPHIAAMRDRLAADIGADVGRVNVKATTTEGMGFAGRREGIACHAVCLLEAVSGPPV
jgi:2-C-methyl-D-erythritol 2,4-cyclodiphosphate synthase